MKNLFKKYGFMFLIFIVIAFWAGYFVSEMMFNKVSLSYLYEVKTEVKVSEVTSDFFKDALKKYQKNEETGEMEFIGYSYNTVKPDLFFDNKDIKTSLNNEGNLVISIKAKYFISSQGATISKDSFNRFNKVLNKVFKYHDKDYEVIKSSEEGIRLNGFLIAGVLSGITLIGEGLYLGIKKKKDEEVIIEKSFNPFSKKFWVLSLDKIRHLKVFDLCFIAILFALQMLCKFIHIPTGFSNLGIGITYLIFSFICLLYGPFWGLIIGFFSDVLGYFIAPTSTVFYFGYTVQAMLTGFTYGFFLFNKKPTLQNALASRLIVNILINAVFGSFLWSRVANLPAGGLRDYFLYLSLPKNILFLIPQALVMYLFLSLVYKALKPKLKIEEEVRDDFH